MPMTKEAIRRQVAEHIRLLAHPSEQLEYERSVPIADVPSELVCGFPYYPKSVDFISAFSNEELMDLAHLYGLLCEAAKVEAHSVSELRKSTWWQAVFSLAKELDDHYRRTP
jgi:hypothetical protein